ncbi:MAG: hypothetical protein HC933_12390 [Pleurocapsa sp. SU_196_0]|nr:hypothetical protein [Pleurocapsa sp. SU_196_0]
MRRFEAHKVDGRAPAWRNFSLGELLVIAVVGLGSQLLGQRLVSDASLQLGVTGGLTLLTYVLVVTLKVALAPYPKVLRHAWSWYGSPDEFTLEPDPSPVPLMPED